MIREMTEKIDESVKCCEDKTSTIVEYVFASDLLNDILTGEKGNFILITGTANQSVWIYNKENLKVIDVPDMN